MQPSEPLNPNQQPAAPAPVPVTPPQPIQQAPLTQLPQQPAAQPTQQPLSTPQPQYVPQPAQQMPAGQPLPVPNKSKKWLKLAILGAVGFVLIGGILAATLYIKSRPKQFTGNYTKLVVYKPKDGSKFGGYSFKYPQSMTAVTETDEEVSFQQKILPKQILKTDAGWESRIQFTARESNLKSLLKSFEDIKLLTRDVASLDQEDMEKAGMTDIQTQARDDLGSKDEPRIVYDYQYKDKTGTVVKGRRIIVANDDSLFRIRMEAIDKIWDTQSAWEEITREFTVEQ